MTDLVSESAIIGAAQAAGRRRKLFSKICQERLEIFGDSP
jgi:hypothetical protein